MIAALLEEPRGSLYRHLLLTASRTCDRVLLVKREGIGVGPAGRAVLNWLGPHLATEKNQQTWPGAVLHGGTAVVRTYRFSPDVARLLGEVAEGLFSWQQPELLEDLCLLRGELPWLTTIAHEADAYLSITAAELATITAEQPSLVLQADADASENGAGGPDPE